MLRRSQRSIAVVVAFFLAMPVAVRAQPLAADDLPLEELPPDLPDVQPLSSTAVEDDHVWEDLSYGTGEADFTAAAVDPENPRRLWAGASGAVFVSDDAGLSWVRVLEVRGGLAASKGFAGAKSESELDNEVEERLQELKDELLEELKKEITDELVSELGDSGEKLAEELAEELAEQRVEEEEDRLREEARADLKRRGSANAGPGEPQGPAPSQPRRIHRLVALPGGRLLVASGSGLYRSTDRGVTFTRLMVGVGAGDVDVRAVAAHPLSPETLFAGTLEGLFTSTDGGASWTGVGDLPAHTAVNEVAVDPAQPTLVLVASDGGVYRSTDAGRAFLPVLQPPSPAGGHVRAVAFDPTDSRIAFAGTEEGLYRSLDRGLGWERLEPPGLLSREVTDLASVEWGLAVATVNGVFLSADAGASFRELYAGLDEREVRRLAAGPTPLALWAATGRGLFCYRPPAERTRRLKALSSIREMLQKEPPLAEVAKAALAAAWNEETPAKVRSRAALAAFAPRVTVRYGAVNPVGSPFVARTVFPDALPGGPLPVPVIFDTLHQTDAWQLLLLWDAQRLLFDPGVLDVSKSFRRTEKLREHVLKRVVNTYDARRRLQVALSQAPPADLRGLAFKTIQVEELTGVLDGLTNGYFSAALAAGASPPTAAGVPRTR